MTRKKERKKERFFLLKIKFCFMTVPAYRQAGALA